MQDILEAAARVSRLVAAGRQALERDDYLQLALVHLMEIIGEACSNVSADLKAHNPEVAWRGAAAFRNRVIHGYFDVDLDAVWEAAANSVPALAADVAAVLDGLTGEDE